MSLFTQTIILHYMVCAIGILMHLVESTLFPVEIKFVWLYWLLLVCIMLWSKSYIYSKKACKNKGSMLHVIVCIGF